MVEVIFKTPFNFDIYTKLHARPMRNDRVYIWKFMNETQKEKHPMLKGSICLVTICQHSTFDDGTPVICCSLSRRIDFIEIEGAPM